MSSQGSWTQPCLLHVNMGHHSLVSSQSPHLHDPASEATGNVTVAEMSGVSCPSTTHTLRCPPHLSMTTSATAGNQGEIKVTAAQPPPCSPALHTPAWLPSWQRGWCAIVFLPCGGTWNVASLKKQHTFRCVYVAESVLLQVRAECETSGLNDHVWKPLTKGNWNCLSSTHSVPEL